MAEHSTISKMPFFKEFFCMITLGLISGGLYMILLIATPILVYSSFAYTSYTSMLTLILIVLISVVPLDHTPRNWLINSKIFQWWCDYFDFQVDCTSIQGKNALDKDKNYMFLEFPHGVFPMGQFLSVSHIKEIGQGMICGTGADVIFQIPFMRQLFSMIGVHNANSKNIQKILKKYKKCAIIPGGIAEIYLTNKTTEVLYLKNRRNTIKLAIKEGCCIIPTMFFGNTRIFHMVNDGHSFLSSVSRALRMSIVMFYGRFYLPIPLRVPLKMATGSIVQVTQCSEPTEEQIDEVLTKVITSITKLYNEKKPDYENRPLVIT